MNRITRKILMTALFIGMTGANYIFLPPEAATVLGVNLCISGYLLWRPFRSGFPNFTSLNTALDIVKSLDHRHQSHQLSSEKDIYKKFHNAFKNNISDPEMEMISRRKIDYIALSKSDELLHTQPSQIRHKDVKNPSC